MGMRGFVVAWAVGEGIIVYRSIRRKTPPLPSMLLATSGLFVGLAVLAEATPELATALAVGVDVAAWLQLFPGQAPPPAPGPAKASASSSAPALVAA